MKLNAEHKTLRDTVLPKNSNSLRENKSPHAGIQRTKAHTVFLGLWL